MTIDCFYEQSYEARIDALQRQVEEQSMTMSMYSSYTPEDFNNIEEDIFGEHGKTCRFRVPIFWCSYARSTKRLTFFLSFIFSTLLLLFELQISFANESLCYQDILSIEDIAHSKYI